MFLAIHQDGSNGRPLLYVGQQHTLKPCVSQGMRNNCHPPRCSENIPSGPPQTLPTNLLWYPDPPLGEQTHGQSLTVLVSISLLGLNQVDFSQRSYTPFFLLSSLLNEGSAPSKERRPELSRLSSTETEQSKA